MTFLGQRPLETTKLINFIHSFVHVSFKARWTGFWSLSRCMMASIVDDNGQIKSLHYRNIIKKWITVAWDTSVMIRQRRSTNRWVHARTRWIQVDLANEPPPCTCHFVSWLVNTTAKRMRKSTSRERARKGKTQLGGEGDATSYFLVVHAESACRGYRFAAFLPRAARAAGWINGAAVSIRRVFTERATRRILLRRALNRRNMHR